MSAPLTCILRLPPGFRAGDILAFHRRDAQEIAERVTASSLEKGMLWRGHPARLGVRFAPELASAELAIDADIREDDAASFEAMVRRMLGLTQPVEDFERRYCEHPQLRRLLSAQAGLRVPVTATPFEALTWAITGQQISVSAAVSLRRRLIAAAGVRHSGGLLCYPDAPRIAAMGEGELRAAGFSTAKARTLSSLARLAADGALPVDSWAGTVAVDEIRERLLAIRGIGPWTVSYTLLRGFGWLDGSLHGDVAVRRSLQALLDAKERIDEEEAKAWLAEFSPWRALVAAHLWAAQSANISLQG